MDFCNPSIAQTFSLYDNGKLMFDVTGSCVGTRTNSSKLYLTECESENITRFTLNTTSNTSTLQHQSEQNVSLCVSTYSTNPYRKLGDPIALTECDEDLSSLNLLEENKFLLDRRALLVPPPPDTQCVGSLACATNNRPDPVTLLQSRDVKRSLNLSECLTVVTKTARRPLLVLRMAQSIRDIQGHDLPIIAYDDGPGNYSDDVWDEMGRFPLLRYVITDDEDLGISKGRNLAIMEVKTKYFLLVDDDNVFNEYTDLTTMVEILDTTDAVLVGGKFTNYRDYSGMMEVSSKKNKLTLTLYMGSCLAANQTIVNFPECVRCDLTSNVFIARTQRILEMGGWSEELKVGEHKDIFLKLKAFGHKVVYCPNFQVYNKKPTQNGVLNAKGYGKLRRGARLNRMKHLFIHRWNISTSVEKNERHFNYKLLENNHS